ncbi:tafazzin [Arthroderma uncinatum]|uniref:tafazzin n=1 Tax=Arthroderma uncinatum TaxID=74035 RepID=UPI00144A5547|nr:tafazzin [Arthroderma uncinatum]KAF3482757.1 tafazzin [Arthroderma uncinatum]
MPKKHKAPSIKPKPAAHPSLESSRSSGHGKATDQQSVNDILQQMRNASSLSKGAGWQTRLAPRSVHPSLRNILELPETPPPRPRPTAARQAIGQRRLRRTPGPPPPLSWVTPNPGSSRGSDSGDRNILRNRSVKFARRLNRLPGATVPSQGSLLHTTLRTMATHWDWHLLYDGTFLSTLPMHIRQLLLTYISVYTDHPSMGVSMKGLEPLFTTHDQESSSNDRAEVTRLDLGFSLGYWLNIKQLSRELKGNIPMDKEKAPVPASWEEEADLETTTPAPGQLDFAAMNNLRYLSLASPAPDAASWVSLLKLLPHLPTLTHLSLAYWPVPTLKPNSLTASVSHAKHKQLTFQYGGSDTYSSYENNWVEASIVLAKLSRTTYSLRWLDLEGCLEWIPALCWDGVDIYGKTHEVTGPEWNGSWRGVEWIELGPGWGPESSAQDNITVKSGGEDTEPQQHDPQKELELLEDASERIKAVGKRIQMIRREGRGKWIHYSDGSERRDTAQYT